LRILVVVGRRLTEIYEKGRRRDGEGEKGEEGMGVKFGETKLECKVGVLS